MADNEVSSTELTKVSTPSMEDPRHGTESTASRENQESAPGSTPRSAESHAARASSPATTTSRASNDHLPPTYFDEPLFQEDNTGTRKYKSLLRGLKNIITKEYSPTGDPDLMPDQLSRYYSDLNGTYDELFIRTPSPSIAFIYKSLGCAFSLQPVAHAEKVEEPTIPALKTEGWIMWSTIQMLLGPDEHAGFLIDAVKKWDVVDPESGKIFPKTIPRHSFPAKADSRMCEWYEGVSERLKKEADEEAEERERQRQMEQHAEHHRMLTGRRDDEADSIDSRGPALAYFRNPLYRHGDGRPSIVRYDVRPNDVRLPDARPPPPRLRHSDERAETRPAPSGRSSRPPLSPKQSMIDKGKSVIRSVASPNLWNGRGSSSSQERHRRSASDGRHHMPDIPPPQVDSYDDRLLGTRLKQRKSTRPGSSPDDSFESDERPQSGRHLQPRKDDREPSLRHSRSHEPTPSQREYGDYFDQAEPTRKTDSSAQDEQKRRQSIGPSFAPSQDLPFAATVAMAGNDRGSRRPPPEREDQQTYPPRDRRGRDDDEDPAQNRSLRHRHNDQPSEDVRARFSERPKYEDYGGRPDQGRPSQPRHRSRSRYSNPPRLDAQARADERPGERVRFHDDPRDDGGSQGERPRRSDRPREPREDDRSQGGRPREDDRTQGGRPRQSERPRDPRYDDNYEDERSARPRYNDRPRFDESRHDSPDRRRSSEAPSRRSTSARRTNASDMDSGYDGPNDEDTPSSSRKQARFAEAPISGVHGRRYVDQSPWQE